MRRFVVVLPLLMSACAPAWPPGSYSTVSGDDAAVLAPAIADYLAGALPAGTPIAVETAKDDQIAPVLEDDLSRAGIQQAKDGRRVQYVADPLDGGVFLRISIDGTEGGSRFFTRSGSSLVPAGPMTVALP
jgi:hypothetical protein